MTAKTYRCRVFVAQGSWDKLGVWSPKTGEYREVWQGWMNKTIYDIYNRASNAMKHNAKFTDETFIDLTLEELKAFHAASEQQRKFYNR